MKLLKRVVSFVFTTLGMLTLGSYKSKPRINFYTRLNKNTFLGVNCHFNGLVIRGKGKVVIGNNFHSGKKILIINSYHKYEGANAIPYDTKEMVHKTVTIEDNVWIGDRVIILGGVTIGNGSIIQAGAVVVNDIPKLAIAGGNPAKAFKYRDISEYEKLEKEGKFC